jgi:hypothetical protein
MELSESKFSVPSVWKYFYLGKCKYAKATMYQSSFEK